MNVGDKVMALATRPDGTTTVYAAEVTEALPDKNNFTCEWREFAGRVGGTRLRFPLWRAHEGADWIRGWHHQDSAPVHALLAADALSADAS